MMNRVARVASFNVLKKWPQYGLAAQRCMGTERAGKAVKPGEALVVDGFPHRVGKITQGKRGKGGGFVRAVLKNLESGQVFEKTFSTDENVETAEMEKEICQYSWNDGKTYSFLNAKTFEEVQLDVLLVDNAQFLLEGQEVKLLKFNSKVLGVELPKICEFEVVKLHHEKTTSGQTCATLNCGAEVFVPPFITEGMKVRINVVEGTYVERA